MGRTFRHLAQSPSSRAARRRPYPFRSLSPRAHRYSSIVLPLALVGLALLHFWAGWYAFGHVLLLVIRFFRFIPIYNPVPLDNNRRFTAALTLVIFILCFMPAPFIE